MNYEMRVYMKEYLPLYIFVSVLFVTGVVFGALMVNSLTFDQKQEMVRHLGSFFHSVDQGTELGGKSSFWQALFMHLKWVLLIFVLGLSVIGLPLILILNFLKGVLVGFTVGYLVGQLSWQGMLFALVSVAPQNLLVIPALIVTSVTAISFSVHLIKKRLLQRHGAVYPQFIGYSTITAAMCIVMAAVSLFEAYVSPSLMKWVTPLLIALN